MVPANGNYDVTNKHFTYIPRVKLAIETLQFPEDIWLIERREWGVLYGFPRRLRYNRAPEHDALFRTLVTFERQSDQWTDGIEANTLHAFKTATNEQLSQLSDKLERERTGQETSLDDRAQMRSAVTAAVRSMHRYHRKVQAAKHALGRNGSNTFGSTLEIRKADCRTIRTCNPIRMKSSKTPRPPGRFKPRARRQIGPRRLG